MNTMTAIGQYALHLHPLGEDALSLALGPADPAPASAPGDIFTFTNQEIVFSSVAARNAAAADFLYATLDTASGDFEDMLFSAAHKLWRDEIGRKDMAAGRLLALAAIHVDVIAAATRRITAGANLWSTLHLVEAVIPFLSTVPPASLVSLVEIIFDDLQRDLAGGIIFTVLEGWYARNPSAAAALHAAALQRVSPASSSLLVSAVVALSLTDFETATTMALADIDSGDPTRAAAGVWAAGRMLLGQEKSTLQLGRLKTSVMQQMKANFEMPRSQAIRAAAVAMLDDAEFESPVRELCRGGDQEMLFALAGQMSFSGERYATRVDLCDLLDDLVPLAPVQHDQGSVLDTALVHFAQSSMLLPTVLGYLRKWAEQHGRRGGFDRAVAHNFPMTISAIGSHEATRRLFVTDWLLADSPGVPSQLQHIFQRWPDSQVPTLDAEIIHQLDDPGAMFLARRVLGFLHDRKDMTSIVLSFLESKAASTRFHPLVRAMLVTELGYDYPSSTITACRAAAEKMPEHRELLSSIASQLEESEAQLSRLPRAKELMPSMQLRRMFAAARAKQLSKAFTEADRKSIFSQLATRITIKAGRGMFAYRDGDFSESTEMRTISHEIELPRREVFDPVGCAIRRIQFQAAKRSEG